MVFRSISHLLLASVLFIGSTGLSVQPASAESFTGNLTFNFHDKGPYTIPISGEVGVIGSVDTGDLQLNFESSAFHAYGTSSQGAAFNMKNKAGTLAFGPVSYKANITSLSHTFPTDTPTIVRWRGVGQVFASSDGFGGPLQLTAGMQTPSRDLIYLGKVGIATGGSTYREAAGLPWVTDRAIAWDVVTTRESPSAPVNTHTLAGYSGYGIAPTSTSGVVSLSLVTPIVVWRSDFDGGSLFHAGVATLNLTIVPEPGYPALAMCTFGSIFLIATLRRRVK